jgi:hypothetical protein
MNGAISLQIRLSSMGFTSNDEYNCVVFEWVDEDVVS